MTVLKRKRQITGTKGWPKQFAHSNRKPFYDAVIGNLKLKRMNSANLANSSDDSDDTEQAF